MKIVIIGSTLFDSMEYNLKEAFIQQGHSCSIVDISSSFWGRNKCFRIFDIFARRYSEIYDRNAFNRVFDNVVRCDPDLVIGVYRFIHPELVRKVKNKGIRIIHINPDALTTFELQQIFVEPYDAYFTKDPYIVHFMKDNMKLNVYHYNEAFNIRSHDKPNMEKSVCEKEVGIDVMTYGTMYPYRCRMLKCVLDAGIDIRIYGVKPNRFYDSSLNIAFQNKYIVGEEKAKLLYGSKIVFNQMHYAEIEGVNCRFFETNGSGAFQLSDYKPILKDILPIDPELVTFKNIDEAIVKIKYYLNNPTKRYEISRTIYDWFKSRYSYDNLVDIILNKI